MGILKTFFAWATLVAVLLCVIGLTGEHAPRLIRWAVEENAPLDVDIEMMNLGAHRQQFSLLHIRLDALENQVSEINLDLGIRGRYLVLNGAAGTAEYAAFQNTIHLDQVTPGRPREILVETAATEGKLNRIWLRGLACTYRTADGQTRTASLDRMYTGNDFKDFLVEHTPGWLFFLTMGLGYLAVGVVGLLLVILFWVALFFLAYYGVDQIRYFRRFG